MRVGIDSPLMVRSLSTIVGPGAIMLMKQVLGTPLARLDGQASRILTVPVTVTVSPCITVSRVKFTSVHPTVRMRRKPSWDLSPWADAAVAGTTVTRVAATRMRRSRRLMSVQPP
jgi:hypothetical protein